MPPADKPAEKPADKPAANLCPDCKRPAPLHTAGCPTVMATQTPEAMVPTKVVEPEPAKV